MSSHIDAVAAMTERCEIFDAMSEANTWRDAIRLHGLAPSEEQDRACLSIGAGPLRARLLPSKFGIIRCSVSVPRLSLVRLARGQLMAGWCVVSQACETRTLHESCREKEF